MNAPDPSKLSDGELSALVAEKVGGWKSPSHPDVISFCDVAMNEAACWWLGPDGKLSPIGKLGCQFPDYATSADAVLPLLDKHENFQFNMGRGAFCDEYFCSIGVNKVSNDGENVSEDRFCGRAPTFPRAACLALLAAHPANHALA